MAYPRLLGRFQQSTITASGRWVLVGSLSLTIVVVILLMRLTPAATSISEQVTPIVTQPVAVVSTTSGDLSPDQQLHLDRAERQLIAAAEQLVAARRLLSSIAPVLARNYLDLERRRTDSVALACDDVLRTIEDARSNINAISIPGRDQR